MLGFLFGIPRTLQSDVPSRIAPAPPSAGAGNVAGAENVTGLNLDYRFNTNLEQISDWLTKIIIGVGLVELGKIANGLTSIGQAVSDNLHAGSTAATIVPIEGVVPLTATGVVFFVVTGFLGGYLWTRLEYGTLLAASDRTTLSRLSEKIQEGTEIARSAERIAGAASFARGETPSSKRNSAAFQRPNLLRLPLGRRRS